MLPNIKNFITGAHELFDEFGYRMTEESQWDDIKIVQSAIDTMNRCTNFEDALKVCRSAQILVENIDKIHEVIIKYPEFWESLEYKNKRSIELLDPRDATTVYLTDAIFSDQFLVLLSSCNFDGNFFLKLKDGKFIFDGYEESPLYLQLQYDAPRRSAIYDKTGKKWMDLILTEGNNISLENNLSNIEIMYTGELMGIFPKDKYDANEELTDDDCLAEIDWDILDHDHPYSMARIDFVGELNGIQKMVIYLISLAAFVAYQRVKACN